MREKRDAQTARLPRRSPPRSEAGLAALGAFCASRPAYAARPKAVRPPVSRHEAQSSWTGVGDSPEAGGKNVERMFEDILKGSEEVRVRGQREALPARRAADSTLRVLMSLDEYSDRQALGL